MQIQFIKELKSFAVLPTYLLIFSIVNNIHRLLHVLVFLSIRKYEHNTKEMFLWTNDMPAVNNAYWHMNEIDNIFVYEYNFIHKQIVYYSIDPFVFYKFSFVMIMGFIEEILTITHKNAHFNDFHFLNSFQQFCVALQYKYTY